MQAFLASLARELRYLRHNPPELFAATALPLLLLALTAWLFSAGVPRGLPIALVDGDRSPQSRALARGLAAAPGIEVVAQPDDLESGWSLLRRLEAYALVHVPHGTRDTLARGGTATVFGYYNAAWQTPGESAYREIQAVVQALGAELASSEVAQALGPGRVRPPPVEVQRTVLYNAAGSYEQYLGLLVHGAMLHLLLCLCAIAAVGRELRDGTAPAWLEACGDRPLAALLGKLGPYLVAFTGYGLTALWFLREWRGPGIAGSYLLLGAAQFTMYAAYAAMGLLFVALTRTMTVSLSLAGFYAGASLAFANVVFPVETGSAFTRLWSQLLPFTHYSRVQQQQVYFGTPWADAAASLGILACFVLLAGGLGAWQFSRIARDPASWGRR